MVIVFVFSRVLKQIQVFHMFHRRTIFTGWHGSRGTQTRTLEKGHMNSGSPWELVRFPSQKPFFKGQTLKEPLNSMDLWYNYFAVAGISF